MKIKQKHTKLFQFWEKCVKVFFNLSFLEENQNQVVVNMGDRPTSHIYLHEYLKYSKVIWHGFSKKNKVDFLSQKFLHTPRNPPMGRNFSLGDQK